MTVLFRCDGGYGKKIGTGHVYRCLTLADLLKNEGEKSIFLMKGNEGYSKGIKIVKSRGFQIYELPKAINNEKEAAYILDTAFKSNVSLTVLNHYPIQKGLIKKLRNKTKTFAFSFFNDINIDADYILNSFVGLGKNAKNNLGSKIYSGPDYFPGHEKLMKLHLAKKPKNQIKKIFVITGGEDRWFLNIKILDALSKIQEPFEATIVLGPASKYNNNIESKLDIYKKEPKFNIIPSLDSREMLKKMYEADFAISAAGDTAYELACVGTPAIYVCQAPHQLKTANAFQDKGAGINLGYGPSVSNMKLFKKIKDLLSDSNLLKEMSQKSKSIVDGKGTERIINKLIEIIKVKK